MKKSIFGINIVVFVIVACFIVFHLNNLKKAGVEVEKDNFVDTTQTMAQIANLYLQDGQRICDVWAAYINQNDLSMREAINFIKSVDQDESTMAQIMYTDTFEGISSIPGPGGDAISYSSADGEECLFEFPNGEDSVRVTKDFLNAVNGERSMAYCNTVHIRDGEGQMREALLMQVVSIEEMQDQWDFQTGIEADAQTSIIDLDGNYILRGEAFVHDNFFDLLDDYSIRNVSEEASLSDEIRNNDLGSFTLKNSKGEEFYFTYCHVVENNDWVFLGYVPVSSMEGIKVDLVLTIVVGATMLFLMCINLAHFLRLSRRLAVSVQEAQTASRAKSDFLSTMSHDIRTPMNAIIGMTTIASKNIKNSEMVADCLRKITMASNHLLTLVNDILDISKVESGEFSLSPHTFSIADSAENLMNIVQPQIKSKNLRFFFHTENIMHEYLYADQLRLNQVLINILSNAVKYTEPGGIVRIDLREETLPDDKMVRLIYKVSDTGVGMTEDFMRTMYKPFAREQDGRIGKIQGTGLGLAITKQMVDLMNGTIECESQVGKGTTFTVMLDFPIAEKMLDDLILPPIRLLMVDDDEVTLVSAKDTLKDIGIQADTCNNGKRAVEMVEEHHLARRDYQIVILDWIMPDMNGLEVTREIRRRIGENIPILIVSAYDWTDIEVEARAAGVSGFISKPLFRSNLYDSINKALQIKEVDESSLEDTAEDLKGTRVLIAEDNDMNWEIISELLSMYEIQADRAVNGQVCVDMVEKAEPGTYQIIFMDIQMPVMNGLDAARAIRKSKVGSHVSQIPIVAMTADAFAENITECRAAGMNDHIPKPVDLNLVLKSMRKLLGNGHRNGGEEYV